MTRAVCIHGHFYQPPRENPWLEAVELQDSAYPHHDWNTRIASECYAPNAAARILDGGRRIVDIVNNYARISFNFGPTLLSWMQKNEPETYGAILEADLLSRERFSGHGAAIAQVYNHMIMPLANERDRQTQVVWGIRDFEHRFGRRPEGMWLAETAVDTATLEVLAAHGIAFTILSPHQARRVRPIGKPEWTDVEGGRIDPRMPYLARLPSGKTIALFFYDGQLAQGVAFGDLLKNGEVFARKLTGTLQEGDAPQLAHVATDGESYGHHRRFGDMALAYCLNFIEEHKLAEITIYGAFLEAHPPASEVEIFENSSWSCVHGIARWRENCGCRANGEGGWQQAWRAPLRGAMDWLRDSLGPMYEEQMACCVRDPWLARDAYIDVVLDRSEAAVGRFFAEHASHDLSAEEQTKVLKLLEMQRHAMLMYTSCGWFFDEISGIETVQVMLYAARVLQLAREVSRVDLEPAYMKLLERAPSNVRALENGGRIYEKLVKPESLDLLRVTAHYAISSLFEDYPETAEIYAYQAKRGAYERLEMGRQKLALGDANVRSTIVLEEAQISFAVLHLGDHNLIGGVRDHLGAEAFGVMKEEITEAFAKGDVPGVIFLMDKHFGTHNYSLWHLFRDEQRAVLEKIIAGTLTDVEAVFRKVYENNYPVMQVMNEFRMPLPKSFASVAGQILNDDLHAVLAAEPIDLPKLEKMAVEIAKWPIVLDKTRIGYVASRALERLVEQYAAAPYDAEAVAAADAVLRILAELPVSLDLWRVQNIYFRMGRQLHGEMLQKSEAGDASAKAWVERFEMLGSYLQVVNA